MNQTVKNRPVFVGQSHLQDDSGKIQFAGVFDPRATCLLETSSGSITLALPANAAFQLAASTDSGEISNDFSTFTAGSLPRASITAKTDSGDIQVRKQ